MAYAFKLERLLVLRIKERDRLAREFAVAKARLQEARLHLSCLESDLEKTQKSLEGIKKEDRLDNKELHYHALHITGLEVDIVKAENEVITANREAAKAMEALTNAHKEAEIMEKLKERDFEAWQKAVLKKEAIAMDELAVSRYRKKEP